MNCFEGDHGKSWLENFQKKKSVEQYGSVIAQKTLANRLKRVIRTIISDTKMTFISDRHVVDGILIANEVVDETKSKNKEVVMHA
ncbi:hypothetical protein MTR_5g064575 [Medicago truncatula]|uniref:Uncharacterized protein n=1 Tax=Medicago truncatula TaxID=3880 RepID=A0A072UEJ9_MEDTR|nr:hypothetical protein MTR_5g064575 [Medicago truncatula]